LNNGYRLIPSRRVYLLDASTKTPFQKDTNQRDLKLLKSSQYQVIDSPADLQTHVERFAELYRALYVDKHSQLNPAFNAEFFRLLLEENILTCRAFADKGKVDAFIGFFVREQMISAAVMGYDPQSPQRRGLYRLAIALTIAEAAERKLLLNLGAGAEKFKMLRGAVPTQEFDAVFDRHLPRRRALPWYALGLAKRLRATTNPDLSR
jgi:hypothetical protein